MDPITLNRQQRAVYNFLKEHSAGQTRLQIAYGTGIERATICRRVAELRKDGRVRVHHKALDPITNTRAEFLVIS